ncbi:unnamed protein product [Didymodactylos carnosus]|nr:unnamed protein product [Didymodactylos carnosus]CAF3693895.1 unnamed protein product [Didymodactylos carnosus]
MNTHFGQNRKDIKITIDPSYNGVAYAGGGQIVISAAWLRNNPEDYDVVTHEGMHIVQSYNRGDPGWLIEGIADYCRWKWGVNNGRAGWSLPDFQRGQHYTNAYRVTARFLVWLERKKNGNIVKQLDTALRSNTYSGNSWNSFAGQGVDQLWTEYSNNPACFCEEELQELLMSMFSNSTAHDELNDEESIYIKTVFKNANVYVTEEMKKAFKSDDHIDIQYFQTANAIRMRLSVFKEDFERNIDNSTGLVQLQNDKTAVGIIQRILLVSSEIVYFEMN